MVDNEKGTDGQQLGLCIVDSSSLSLASVSESQLARRVRAIALPWSTMDDLPSVVWCGRLLSKMHWFS